MRPRVHPFRRSSRLRLAIAFSLALLAHVGLSFPIAAWLTLAPEPSEEVAAERHGRSSAPVPAQVLTSEELEALLADLSASAATPPLPAPPTLPPVPPTEAPKDDVPDRQIVTIPPPPVERRPADAKYLSSYDSQVQREQKSAAQGIASPEMRRGPVFTISSGDDPDGDTTDRDAVTQTKRTPDRERATDQAKPGVAVIESPTVGEPDRPTERAAEVEASNTPTTDEGAPDPDVGSRMAVLQPEVKRARSGGQGAVGGASAPVDYHSLMPNIGPQDLARQEGTIDALDQVPVGDGTMLNTLAYRHAFFYNRVKESIARVWMPDVGSAHRRHDPTTRVYGIQDRTTVISFVLRPDGSLEDALIALDSGAPYLDEVALRAIREAQPFPNPPSALMDGDGRIHMRLAFHLDIDTGEFSFFRY
ncbi:MAG: energy transducer TonB [Myxococcales bacterium]|nr:energy transducer TonB [Myxococcales bacterium]